MEYKIVDLMDAVRDDSIRIGTKQVASAQRIKELTMEKIKRQQDNPTHKRGMRRPLKGMLTLAAVLALLLALGATAYAANLFGLREALTGRSVMEYENVDPLTGAIQTDKEHLGALVEKPVRVLSIQGLRGTPEFEAAKEYNAFLDDYWAKGYYGDEVPNPALRTDPWYDGPGYIYLAFTPTMKEKVQELCERYDLKQHARHTEGNGLRAFTEYLGVDGVLEEEAFADQPWCLDSLCFLGYDAGGFLLQFSYFPDGAEGERFTDMALTRCVKGYLRSGYELLDPEEALDEWTYTTDEGDIVSIIMGEQKAIVLYDGDAAFLTLAVNLYPNGENEQQALDRETVERIAELVDFGLLGQQIG